MYSTHVWILLRESSSEIDDGNLAVKIEALRALVCERLSPVPKNPIHQVNCDRVLQFSESHNHRGDCHDRLLDVLGWVTQELPGSYGLVYWHDDEHPEPGISDGYRVIRVARGALSHFEDRFLSPIRPVVEDEH